MGDGAIHLKTLAALAAFVALAACTLGERQPIRIYGLPRYSELPRNAAAFDCDTAANRRSEWRQPVGDAGSVRGVVFFASVRGPALANVLVRGPADGIYINLLFTIDVERRHLLPEVRSGVAPAKYSTKTLGPVPVHGAAFELEWKPSLVRVRVDSSAPWLEVPIDFTPDELVLGCASGYAVFHSLHIVPATTALHSSLPTRPHQDPAPQNVPPTVLEQLRIAGKAEVTPDPETQAQIASTESKRAVGSFKLCIDATGAPSALELLKSTGYPTYDDKIAAAIEQWRYSPYRVQDSAVAVCTAVTFIYRTPVADHAETPHERALREGHEQP